MKFLAVATLFAATALAVPQAHKGGDVTSNIHQKQNQCKSENKYCCAKKTGGTVTKEQQDGLLGLLGGSLNGLTLGLFEECSPLLAVGGSCNTNNACCAGSESNAEGGLANVALPCVALPVQL